MATVKWRRAAMGNNKRSCRQRRLALTAALLVPPCGYCRYCRCCRYGYRYGDHDDDEYEEDGGAHQAWLVR